MRRFPLIFGLLLSGCGSEAPRLVALPPAVPADLLQPEPGWTGPPPQTDGDLVAAAAAEMQGRERANAKLTGIAQILDAGR